MYIEFVTIYCTNSTRKALILQALGWPTYLHCLPTPWPRHTRCWNRCHSPLATRFLPPWIHHPQLHQLCARRHPLRLQAAQREYLCPMNRQCVHVACHPCRGRLVCPVHDVLSQGSYCRGLTRDHQMICSPQSGGRADQYLHRPMSRVPRWGSCRAGRFQRFRYPLLAPRRLHSVRVAGSGYRPSSAPGTWSPHAPRRPLIPPCPRFRHGPGSCQYKAILSLVLRVNLPCALLP